MKAKYVNPYTDFGFKKLFGEEANKNLLVDFLNELLPIEHKIVELSFQNPEQLGVNKDERKAVYDIFCKNSRGEQFIVEMQKARINFFKERSVFYATFPITAQAEKGEWDFKLNPVYCVALLDFVFNDGRSEKECISQVQLKDQFCQVFYNKLTFVFIEMPRFTKTESQLESHFDKWLYFLKNLENFEGIPEILKEEVFVQGFRVAEIANFNQKEIAAYEASLKVYRDLTAVLTTARGEGKLEGLLEGEAAGIKKGKAAGIKEGKEAVAKKLKEKGFSLAEIAELTGLATYEID